MRRLVIALGTAALVVALALGLWFYWVYLLSLETSVDPLQQHALVGDSFAPLTAALTALALILAAGSVLLQTSELKAQREELKLSRMATERQIEEMRLQREAQGVTNMIEVLKVRSSIDSVAAQESARDDPFSMHWIIDLQERYRRVRELEQALGLAEEDSESDSE